MNLRINKRHSVKGWVTWLLDDKQDGLAAGVLVVLETLHAVVLVLVGAVDRVCMVKRWPQRQNDAR